MLNYFGSRLGRAYCETGEDEADENTVIENILNGQYSHPILVVAFNTAEGWSRDMTEDIARAVLDLAERNSSNRKSRAGVSKAYAWRGCACGRLK